MPTIYSEGYSAIWEMWAEVAILSSQCFLVQLPRPGKVLARIGVGSHRPVLPDLRLPGALSTLILESSVPEY